MDRARRKGPAALPTYRLYGEQERSPAADPLHCESIAARSRLHDWEIRPHRHESMFQLVVVQRGRALAALDGVEVALSGPALITVPPLTAHGFSFAPTIQGLVFTVIERHVAGWLERVPGLQSALWQLRGWPVARDAARAVFDAGNALREEMQSDARWRSVAIDAALLRLLVTVARAAPAAADSSRPPERALVHLRRYRALVESQFRTQPRLGALAGQLGITAAQLNRVCRRVLSRPALAVLHERLLVEAQRDLAYTTMSIKQIALDLGFSDAAYFTRFFQRLTGQTPTAWRSRAPDHARSPTDS